MNVSQEFTERCRSLYSNMKSRGKEKRDKNERIIRKGYELPFSSKQFMAWLHDQFGGERKPGRCGYCGAPIDAFSCSLDHRMPLSRSGSPGLENLDALVCETCNQIKGKMTTEEYKWFRDRVIIEMGVRFIGTPAVADIMGRLERSTKLAAQVRFALAKKRTDEIVKSFQPNERRSVNLGDEEDF